MKSNKIYVASSWRNPYYEEVLEVIRGLGYSAYDFKNPRIGGPAVEKPEKGFAWTHIVPSWTGKPPFREDPRYVLREMLNHSIAWDAFCSDFGAMAWADTCVLVLPSGRSAHIEAGWMSGSNKKLIVYMPPVTEECSNCHGDGWVSGNDPMRNDQCPACKGTGQHPLWAFEPELMYLVGGPAQIVLAFNYDELEMLLGS